MLLNHKANKGIKETMLFIQKTRALRYCNVSILIKDNPVRSDNDWNGGLGHSIYCLHSTAVVFSLRWTPSLSLSIEYFVTCLVNPLSHKVTVI